MKFRAKMIITATILCIDLICCVLYAIAKNKDKKKLRILYQSISLLSLCFYALIIRL